MKKIKLVGGTNNGIIADVPDIVLQRGVLRTYKRGTEVIEQYKIVNEVAFHMNEVTLDE